MPPSLAPNYAQQIATLIAGPGGAMVLLALVLYLVYKLIERMVNIMEEHLDKVETKLSNVDNSLQLIAGALIDKDKIVQFPSGEKKVWPAESNK